MKESTSDIILHPVRMRIIQCLVNQQLTVQQMKDLLPDIPQATLYRHLKKLLNGQIIHIVDEIPNRGTLEKIYSIHLDKVNISAEELSALSKKEHLGIFIQYMNNLMGEYERYLQQGDIDLVKDGVALRQTTFYLTDDEFNGVVKELGGIYERLLNNKPREDRRKRTFATLIIPEPRNRD